jgi:hypothetical protein
MSAGQIYDLGYKRYVGTRRSFGTRWRVIMRHQIATAWKGWWRFKVWMIAGMLATAIVGGVMYFMSGRMFRMIGGMSGELIKFADGLLPWSTLLYCKVGFAVSLVLCSTVVAGDVQSGAFTFYFARSVRPRDYVIGKLVGLCFIVGLIMLVGPFVLAGVRLGLSEDVSQLLGLLPLVYKALALGVAGTLIYAAIPLGFSAAVTNRRYAMAMWAAYYVVIGSMAQGLGALITPGLGAIDLAASLFAVASWLFETRLRGGNSLNVPADAALISILIHTAAAISLVFWRVRHSHHSGVGGSS